MKEMLGEEDYIKWKRELGFNFKLLELSINLAFQI